MFDEAAEVFIRTENGGRVTSPEALIRRAYQTIRQSPERRAARVLIATQQLRMTRVDQALAMLRAGDAESNDCALTQRVLGHAYFLTTDLEAADGHFRRSAQLEPCWPDPWYGRGLVAESRGDLDRAISFYERGCFFEEGSHACAVALANLYVARREIRHAIAALRPALSRNPRSAVLNETYASLLLRRAARLRRRRQMDAAIKSADEALEHLNTAAEVAPSAELYTRIGTGELRRECFAAARKAFESALRLEPSHRPALTRLAGINVDEGHLDEAKSQFQTLIASDEASALAHFRYSRIRRFRPGAETDQYVSRLRVMLNDPALEKSQSVQLLFTIAKVLDDCGRHDQAWEAYEAANQMKLNRRGRSDDSGRMKTLASDQIEYLDAAFIDRFRGCVTPTSLPIFIVGMPRSGTTLTEQILCCHADVSGAGELKHIERLRCRLFRTWQQRIAERDGQVADFGELRYRDVLPLAEPDDFKEFSESYLLVLQKHRGQANRVTDKMPTNFNHLGLIAVCFPGATIVHCQRDPMDILASSLVQNLTPPFCDPQLLADYYIQYRRLMDHWTRVLPLRIIDVPYEQMVTAPDVTTRKLIERCGLPWQDACLHSHENRRAVHTPSKFQVRQPMYTTSVGKWKRFEKQLGPIAESLRDYR